MSSLTRTTRQTAEPRPPLSNMIIFQELWNVLKYEKKNYWKKTADALNIMQYNVTANSISKKFERSKKDFLDFARAKATEDKTAVPDLFNKIESKNNHSNSIKKRKAQSDSDFSVQSDSNSSDSEDNNTKTTNTKEQVEMQLLQHIDSYSTALENDEDIQKAVKNSEKLNAARSSLGGKTKFKSKNSILSLQNSPFLIPITARSISKKQGYLIFGKFFGIEIDFVPDFEKRKLILKVKDLKIERKDVEKQLVIFSDDDFELHHSMQHSFASEVIIEIPDDFIFSEDSIEWSDEDDASFCAFIMPLKSKPIDSSAKSKTIFTTKKK